METITSRSNPLAVHVKKLGVSRSYRRESGEFLCDGIKLLEDAVKSGAEITTVLASARIPFPLPAGARVLQTERAIIDSLSPMKNSQDILFTCKIPPIGVLYEQETDCMIHSPGTRILLDGMQDPGNVGTIIRTADAFGIKCVILTDGCADIYNPKTVRATMGAIFRQQVRGMDYAELAALRDNGARFIAAALGSDCADIADVSLSGAIIAIGGEGRGLSREILSLCDAKITIPIDPACQSLNAAVAAAIIMWEARARVSRP